MDSKIKYKPWGKEVWLELNDFYCYKRIYINKGYRTSLQYHEKKLETNYLIVGEAIMYLEDENKVLQSKIIKTNDFFTVLPGRLHRLEALTDIILQEVSTPQVDDVIRVEDDVHRPSGIIKDEQLNPAFCILAAGIGSRMKDLTTHTNKCLLPIDGIAMISIIINSVPKEYDIVIAVGYKSNLVKSYCDIVHIDRKITYVEIDKFIGVGSGPGYSMMKCKEYLQRPFYFTVSDGFVHEKIPALDYNWIGMQPMETMECAHTPEIYSSLDIDENANIKVFKNKSNNSYKWACIGTFGILDYRTFWEQLEANISVEGEIVSAFYNPFAYKKIKGEQFTYYDVGNKEQYNKKSKNVGLVKIDGSNTYCINNKIIKTFPDKLVCLNKIERSKILGDLVPTIDVYNDHTYSYQKIEGKTLYNTNLKEHIIPLLNWLNEKVWIEQTVCDELDYDYFYKDKTIKRLNEFLSKKGAAFEQDHIINEIKTQSINSYLDIALKTLKNWNEYAKNTIKNFHGDLQFDNIILTPNNQYKFIDWRDTFGRSINGGDLYYDLAKMYGGILMSYDKMKYRESYEILYTNEYDIHYRHYRESEEIEHMFEKWINDNNYDMKIIKIITSLIYLNMCALHEEPMDEILFFKSKLMFNDIFNGNK